MLSSFEWCKNFSDVVEFKKAIAVLKLGPNFIGTVCTLLERMNLTFLETLFVTLQGKKMPNHYQCFIFLLNDSRNLILAKFFSSDDSRN